MDGVEGTPFADRLFGIFDQDQDGTVDFSELMAGLSILCKGDPEEKLRCKLSLPLTLPLTSQCVSRPTIWMGTG